MIKKEHLNKNYSISEVQDLFGIPADEINFFCDHGLISFQQKKKYKRKFKVNHLFELYIIQQIALHIAIDTRTAMVDNFKMLAENFLETLEEKINEEPLQSKRG